MKISKIRGVRDLTSKEAAHNRKVIEILLREVGLYGYREVSTPIIEREELFLHSLGLSSDIVNKEMYCFKDSGKAVALRPEGTASIARAYRFFASDNVLPLRLFYEGPMFRRERPQKGRFRQFHQAGIELLGSIEAYADIEVIFLAHKVLQILAAGVDIELQINTLGGAVSREKWRKELLSYFARHKSKLSALSLYRLSHNPLRILDSKEEEDQELIESAPIIDGFLGPKEEEFFNDVKSGLDNLSIDYVVNPYLVRGIDYYCQTAFEFVCKDSSLGSQSTILAGGRYDGLVEKLSGIDVCGIGWALGVDRVAMISSVEGEKPLKIGIIPVSQGLMDISMKLVCDLRSRGYNCDLSFSGNLKNRLQRALKLRCDIGLILGQDELSKGKIIFRNLVDNYQEEIDFSVSKIEAAIDGFRAKDRADIIPQG